MTSEPTLFAVRGPAPAPPPRRSPWESLRHFGLFLGPAQAAALESIAPEPLSFHAADRLRRLLNRFEAGEQDVRPAELAASVLEEVCGLGGHGPGRWLRGSHVGAEHARTLVSGETIRPQHLWTGANGGTLPVFIERHGRVGLGRGRKRVSECLQWLRAAHLPFALLTNGRQWRLLYASLDHDAACEADIEQWFEGGEPGPQLDALRLLLSPRQLDATTPGDDPPLLLAVRASRRGQSQELSSILGERVREAVEALVQAHGPVLVEARDRLGATESDLYRAAVRIVMRMVVVLFAESRDLLPRGNPCYQGAYGLEGLFADLDRRAARGRSRLEHQFGAWPRVLALFRLLYEGSHHEALPVRAYGGDLFAPGSAASDEPLSRALHVFETACFERGATLMPDVVVHRMLHKLTRTPVRIRQGRASTSTVVPVNFADLQSEYIGILYEGLLDYELRTAPTGEPILFLAVGDEPALPLSRLEGMSDRQIKDLLQKMAQAPRDADSDAEAEEDEDAAAEEDGEAEEDAAADGEAGDGGEEEGDGERAADPEEAGDDDEEIALVADEEGKAADRASAARARVLTWAERAARVAGLVRKPRGRLTPEREHAAARELAAAARRLTSRIVLPGEWYLVRWGGTRKGAGTFYTRPQLAVPTVHRTLRPLAYDPPTTANGDPDRDAAPERWTPKRPERSSRSRSATPRAARVRSWSRRCAS